MNSSSQVFIHEYISGGGWPHSTLPKSLAYEALGMLWTLLADFSAWGGVYTITTLDLRLKAMFPKLDLAKIPAGEVIFATPGNYQVTINSLLARSDAALFIAPETEGVLARLSRQAESNGVPLLCSSSAAVTIAGDKAACYRRFRHACLPTPVTRQVPFADATHVALEMGYPLVTKPVDGVGCEGVCLVYNPEELEGALGLLRRSTGHAEILLQSFVDGEHASVSLLVAENRALPLSLNGQMISPGCPFSYHGGVIPLAHPLSAKAIQAALAAAGLIPGLRGYVGVDLILTHDEAFLIEINPRITTSYIGLRQVLQLNLAQAIWNACSRDVLPAQAPLHGQVKFFKADPLAWLEPGMDPFP